MFIQDPKDILTLRKHVHRKIENMVSPINSILVIQTMNGKHAAGLRVDVSHLEAKKNLMFAEVLERIRFVCVQSCFYVYSCFFTCTCFVVTTMCFLLFMYSCFFHVVRASLSFGLHDN